MKNIETWSWAEILPIGPSSVDNSEYPEDPDIPPCALPAFTAFIEACLNKGKYNNK